MVLEERPVIMVWIVLSAAYRVVFRDLMNSLGVGGEDNIEMDTANHACPGLHAAWSK
jgi:hypothetical protein